MEATEAETEPAQKLELVDKDGNGQFMQNLFRLK